MSTGKAFAVQLAPTFTPAPSIALNGVMTSVGHAATALAPVALGAAAAAGAVFLTRAALRGLATLDDVDQAAAREVAANRDEILAWDRVFAEVAVRNARILRLREMAASAPAEPFVYGCQTREKVIDWCRKTDVVLADAERWVADARILAAMAQPVSEPARIVRRRVERSLVHRMPAPEPVGPPTSSPTRPSTPTPSLTPSAEPSPTGLPTRPKSTMDWKVARQPVVDDILSKAVGKVSPDDFGLLTEKAADVLAQDSLRAMKTELDELYLMADRARRAQERRAADALLAAQWLVGLAPIADQPAGMSAYQLEIMAALRAVAAERRELDPALREAVEGLVGLAVAAAADRATMETFARELEALGYAVRVTDEGVGHALHLSATRPEWGDAHRATIEVRSGDLVAAFETVAADAAGRPDLHVQTWAKHVFEARDRAAEQGVRSGKVTMPGYPAPGDDTDSEAGQDVRASHRNQLRERPTPTC